MPPIQKQCKITGQNFSVSEEEMALLAKMNLPLPEICYNERFKRLFMIRNVRNLYKRKCDRTGKSVIAMYSENVPFPVYDRDEWWKDDWNPPFADFDFNRPFFTQIIELRNKVPRANLFNKMSFNSDYCNVSQGLKDSYLTFVSFDSKNLLYCQRVVFSEDLVDCFYCTRVQRSYECIYCFDCFNVRYSVNVRNSSDSAFLYDCVGCRNCFMCTNLRKKEYYILNQPHSKEEYERKMSQVNFGSYATVEALKKHFNDFRQQNAIYQAVKLEQTENCTGNRLRQCKDLKNCFEAEIARDCFNCIGFAEAKDTLDSVEFGGLNNESELGYGLQECLNYYNFRFCSFCYGKASLTYCDECHNCIDCFACVGLKNAQYCIFNKQYPKEEYEQLVPKIIEHMQKTGEWGQFFPYEYSPFAYNEAEINEYSPLTRDEALMYGFRWNDRVAQEEGQAISFLDVPDNIKNTEKEIIEKVFICDISGKKFKITPQELVFYKQQKIPLPRRHPNQRHKDRLKERLPRMLFSRNCMKCGVAIRTPYAQNRSEIVYCQDCYLKTVY